MHQNQLDENFENLLELALKRNKFGCALLKAGLLDKALKQFIQVLQTLNNPNYYSNIYQNIGLCYLQMRNNQKAKQNFLQVINISPYNLLNIDNNYDLPKTYLMNEKINSYNAFVDAHSNLAVLFLIEGDKYKAYEYCQKTLNLDSNNYEAYINLGDMNKRDDAIDITWKAIEMQINSKRPQKIQICKQYHLNNHENVNILTVKWGSRYGPEYVNKLFRGIKLNSTIPFKFYCFTDDATNLNSEIVIKQLDTKWTKWWGKATLFDKDNSISGLNIYLDIDMIVVNNIDQLLTYNGQLAFMKTDDIQCENNVKDGINSSIMLWNSKDKLLLDHIYSQLNKNFETINKFIVRFDYWLEMITQNVEFVQDLYPGMVQDYVKSCQKEIPQNACIINFPRTPKPENYPSEWIKQHWV